MEKIEINTSYITLNQLLKMINIISSGAQAKYYLLSNDVYINDILDNRRNKKLYHNDIIKINNNTYLIKQDVY